MKLKELIQHKNVTTKRDNRKFHYDNPQYNDDDLSQELNYDHGDGRLGTGEFAIVYPDKDDPHMVNRRGRIPGNEKRSKHSPDMLKDSFISYAKWVVRNKLWNENIHFPRIYVTEYDEANDIFDYKIEKLVDYRSLNRKMLLNVMYKYFTDDIMSDATTVTDLKKLKTNQLMYQMCYILDEVIYEGTKGTVKDEEFKRGFDILLKGIKDNDWEWDGHRTNVMFRITGTGPQLVFTDPVR